MASLLDRVDRRLILLVVILLAASFMGIGLVVKTPPKLAIAAVMGLVLFFVCFTNTEITLYVLVFSMLLSPEFGARGTMGGGMTIRLDDILLMLIGFTWLARIAIYKELGLFFRTSLNKPIFRYILFCTFSTAIGMLAGRVRVTGFFFVLKYMEYFVVYFMAANYLRSMKQIRSFLIAMLVTCAIVSLVGLAQIPTGGRITAPFEGEEGEPNTLGGYLVLMLSMVLGLLLTLKERKKKAPLYGLVPLIVVPLLFTGSRGSWLAAIPMYLIFLILSKNKIPLVIGMVFVGLATPALMPEEVKNRFTYTFKKEQGYGAQFQEKVGGVTLDTSASARLKSWKAVPQAVMKRLDFLLLGYGVTGWPFFVDAQYLKVLVDTGAIGLALFLMLIVALMREVWRIYRGTDDPFPKGMALGLLIGTVSMLAHSISTNTFIIVRIMEPFWFLAAMVLALPRVMAEEGEKPGREGLAEPGTPEEARTRVLA